MKNLFSISKTYKAKHKTKSQHLWSVSRKNFYKNFLGIPLATFWRHFMNVPNTKMYKSNSFHSTTEKSNSSEMFGSIPHSLYVPRKGRWTDRQIYVHICFDRYNRIEDFKQNEYGLINYCSTVLLLLFYCSTVLLFYCSLDMSAKHALIMKRYMYLAVNV